MATRLICNNGLNVPTKTKRVKRDDEMGCKKLTKAEQKEAQELWDAFLTKQNIPTMKERYGKNARQVCSNGLNIPNPKRKRRLTHEQKYKALEKILFTEQGLPIPDRSIYNP
jgi:hypothetical protein